VTDLEELGEIADQMAVGHSGLSMKHIGKRPAMRCCGSPDHMKGANVRTFRNTATGKVRRSCRLCEQLRRRSRSHQTEGCSA